MTIYGRSEELVSRCIECDLAEPESLASLGGSAPGLVDGILSCRGVWPYVGATHGDSRRWGISRQIRIFTVRKIVSCNFRHRQEWCCICPMVGMSDVTDLGSREFLQTMVADVVVTKKFQSLMGSHKIGS